VSPPHGRNGWMSDHLLPDHHLRNLLKIVKHGNSNGIWQIRHEANIF
jgi:hypothetical protein